MGRGNHPKKSPKPSRESGAVEGGCPAGSGSVWPGPPGAVVGSVWTWTAIDAGTKLVPWFHVGTRDAGCASEFMQELAPRLRGRVQLTTDGHKAYLEAVHNGFGREIDYAMLVKLYGAEPSDEARYSPPKCIGTRTEV